MHHEITYESLSDYVAVATGRSFVKGSQLFKLKYTYLDVCENDNGSAKCLEAGDSSGQQGPLIHTVSKTRMPIPHLEQPTVSKAKPPFRVTFLEAQTIQTAQIVFSAQPAYTFENWDDCVRFQEALLAHKVIFVAGIAEAKSKGRGEECISQNLRILQARNGIQTIIFFANSQCKERKKYISIPVNCIDQIEQNKKPGRPISLRLQPNLKLLSELKVLHIQFLDDDGTFSAAP
ncbi:hypothetical protein GJ744_002818 [Endocarpon pusillum]|uniref:Uncharacterized protein n=1 Tax=Endocarpon pusillum TaxID=364733 RepID=A0A8H7AVX0_9EURO|nr:hypothetical protein GJ744_002818 [Endocarpon pusillum]